MNLSERRREWHVEKKRGAELGASHEGSCNKYTRKHTQTQAHVRTLQSQCVRTLSSQLLVMGLGEGFG